jgi:hypothetical protein
VEKVYKTHILIVNMVDPLLDHLPLRPDEVHAVRFDAHARSKFVGGKAD